MPLRSRSELRTTPRRRVTERGKVLTTCQTRHKHQQMRGFNCEAADLSSAEDGTCGAETPVTTHPERLDDDVRTNTYTDISFGAIIAMEEA